MNITREELDIKLKEFKDRHYTFDRDLSFKDISWPLIQKSDNIFDDFYDTFKDIKVWDIISTEPFKCRLICLFNTEIHIALSNSSITFNIKI